MTTITVTNRAEREAAEAVVHHFELHEPGSPNFQIVEGDLGDCLHADGRDAILATRVINSIYARLDEAAGRES